MPEVKRVAAAKSAIMDPNSAIWESAVGVDIALQPVPLLMIPSEYVQTTVRQDEVGAVKAISVKAIHDGKALYFRLEWQDPSKDDDVSQPHLFADGAAIMFPFGADAPLALMGSALNPVNQWLWRANLAQPYNVTTAGIGTSYWTPKSFIEAGAIWEDGRWRVVLARPLATEDPENHVQFKMGQLFKAAFCIWEGSKKERAGLKSFTAQWTEYTWGA